MRPVADVQVLAVHWRTGFSQLRGQYHAHRFRSVVHAERGAEVANHRGDDVAFGSATQTNRRRVDRFLAEGAESLPLKRGVSPADLAAGEELLEAIVDRAGENHAAENLELLVNGERCGDRFAPNESIAVGNDSSDRLPQPL